MITYQVKTHLVIGKVLEQLRLVESYWNTCRVSYLQSGYVLRVITTLVWTSTGGGGGDGGVVVSIGRLLVNHSRHLLIRYLPLMLYNKGSGIYIYIYIYI